MTHEVKWVSSTDGGGSECTVRVTLKEFAKASTRDFMMAMDEALEAAEDIFCGDYQRRTGKTL